MAGKNNGTGQPICFRCAKCRSTTRHSRFYTGGYLSDVSFTGRTRKRRKDGQTRGRMSDVEIEYVCACGHVGWTAHINAHMRKNLQEKQHDHSKH